MHGAERRDKRQRCRIDRGYSWDLPLDGSEWLKYLARSLTQDSAYTKRDRR